MKHPNPIRINAYLAKCGISSRRNSERFIIEGRVLLNGKQVEHMATLVYADDNVQLDRKRVQLESILHYLVLHKPKGYLCSNRDTQGRPLTRSLLPFPQRIFHVGRLDFLSSGLIFYTNDGTFTQKILHPSQELEKEYVVDTSQKISFQLLQQYKKGLWIEGIRYQLKSCTLVHKFCVHLVLVEGKNREIRRVFSHYRIPVKRIHRIRIGEVRLNGLEEKQYRHLTPLEIRSLTSNLGGNPPKR